MTEYYILVLIDGRRRRKGKPLRHRFPACARPSPGSHRIHARKHGNLSLSASNALRRGEGGPADGSGMNLAARQPSLYDGPSTMTWMASTMEVSLA